MVCDDDAQSARAQALISEDQIFIPVTVMLELEWVLRTRYAFAPTTVAQALAKITALGNVVVGERAAVLAATAKVALGWDFADALHHALSVGCDDFTTFDADLARRAKRDVKLAPVVTKL